MKDKKLHESITLTGPNGHRLRADASFVGKTVKCPRCAVTFVISASQEDVAVSDSAVMRILGDGPAAPVPPTDLNEMQTRPCPRCGMAIAPDTAVCDHCHCYLGLMPSYMNSMTSDRQTG